MTNTETIQNLSYESKLKELIKGKIYYNFALKSNQNDDDFRNEIVDHLLEGINPKYYEYLFELISSRIHEFHVTSGSSAYYGFGSPYSKNDGSRDIKIGTKCPSVDFAHELGHASDNYQVEPKEKNSKYYSFLEIKDASLDDTLHEEVSRVVPKIYNSMRRFLNKSLNEELGPKSFELLETFDAIENAAHRLVFDQPSMSSKGGKEEYISDLYDYLYKGIKDTVDCKRLKRFIRKYLDSNTYKELCANYGGAIIDMMSSMYDVNPYRIYGHSINYFKSNHNLGAEFFAEFFSYVLVEDEHNLELMKKYFPKSYRKAKIVFNKVMEGKEELLLK